MLLPNKMIPDSEHKKSLNIIKSRKSKKDRQHNVQKKKDRQHNVQKKKNKRTNNDIQTFHRKLKFEEHEPHKKTGGDLGCPGRVAMPSCYKLALLSRHNWHVLQFLNKFPIAWHYSRPICPSENRLSRVEVEKFGWWSSPEDISTLTRGSLTLLFRSQIWILLVESIHTCSVAYRTFDWPAFLHPFSLV